MPRQRLGVEDIQSRARDPTLAKRSKQGGFLHDRSTGRVDEETRGLHEAERRFIDEVMGIVGQRDV
ncbi:MAG: hypothetical protein P8Y94_12570 [Acidobacteriota bacterium]